MSGPALTPATDPLLRPAGTVPHGLPGLDPRYSHVLRDARGATWHYLDTGPELARHGVTPVGTVLAVHGNPTWSYLWRDLVTDSVAAAQGGGAAWRVVAVDQLEMGFSARTGEHRPLARRPTKQNKPGTPGVTGSFRVGHEGLEPSANGLRVHCSTN